MSLSHHLAQHFNKVFVGMNWTASNLKDQLDDVTWQEATTQIHDLNTIAKLTFHIHYYVAAIRKVLQGGPLDAHDKYSFDLPPIQSTTDWEHLTYKVYEDAAAVTLLIEQLPDTQLWETFADEKYGSYFRNIQGLIEHTHYHLGQIAILKKLIKSNPF